jgi:peptide/nickel transport system permease protein
MGPLIIRRLIELPFAVFTVIVIVFVALISTGDPVEMMVPPDATEADKQRVREAYGLDKPAIHQFGLFMSRAVRGDFGTSLYRDESALRLVLQRFPTTAKLAVTSVGMAIVIGVPLGMIAALRRGSLIDMFAMGIGVAGQTIANFWLALMLILLFSVRLRWFPVSGEEGGIRALILPAFALSVWLMALLARMTRSGMLEVMGEDFIRTARAKGLSERAVVFRHALRHVLSPLITLVSLSLGWQLGGAVVIEAVFAWRGVGTLLLESVLRRDYPVVLAGVTILAMCFILLNMIADILYPLIDARVRHLGGGART